MTLVFGLLGISIVLLSISVWWHLRGGIAKEPIIGNPRAPRAILRFVIHLILAVLGSQAFRAAMARYAVRH
jgi:hypothetical protein